MAAPISCRRDWRRGTLQITAVDPSERVMSEPAFQMSAEQWPYDPADQELQVAPIGGEPWPATRFEQLWTSVEAANGPMLRAIAEVEAAAR